MYEVVFTGGLAINTEFQFLSDLNKKDIQKR